MTLYLQAGETWATCPWWFVWTLGAFLLGAMLAWLITPRPKPVDTTPIINDRDRYHTAATTWEKNYQDVKYRLDESLKAEADLRANLQRCEADRQTLRYRAETAEAKLAAGAEDIPAPTPAAPSALLAVPTGPVPTDNDRPYAGLFAHDELQIIEGIGPRVTEVLAAAGYGTWETLASASGDELRDLLNAAGSRFGLSDPSSWPHQAALAAAGKWSELIEYQRFTDGGRETDGGSVGDAKFEKMAAKKLGFSSANPQDLKVVEGIGPKIESILKEGGIADWRALARANQESLTAILAAAGTRYRLASPVNWPDQAALAAAGDWKGLKEYQRQLKLGRTGKR